MVYKASDDKKHMEIRKILDSMGFCIDFTRFTEDGYFELKDARESLIKVEPENGTLPKMLLNVIDGTIKLLSYKYDIDDDVQAQRDAQSMVFHKLVSQQIRLDYIEKLSPLRPIIDKACQSIKSRGQRRL